MAISENDIMIENDDVKVVNGDFDIRDVNEQNIKHILIAQPGQFISSPSVGAMIWKLQNENITDFREVIRAVASELIKDGYSYPDFINTTESLENIKLVITAKRNAEPKREVI